MCADKPRGKLKYLYIYSMVYIYIFIIREKEKRLHQQPQQRVMNETQVVRWLLKG